MGKNSRNLDSIIYTDFEVEVEIEADKWIKHTSDDVLKNEYESRFDEEIEEIDLQKKLIIKLVQENDKRTALYELEKLLDVYSDWVNYA